MTENGYMNSFVNDNNKNEYRDSGFNDDDDYSKIDDNYNKGKIIALNVSNGENNSPQQKEYFLFNLISLNEWICILNILSSTLGVGVFVYTYIIYQLGIFSFLFIFIFISITVYYSLDLLRRFVVDSKLFSFSVITQTNLGNCWLKIYAVSAFLFYMSCIANHSDFLYKFMESMLTFLKDGFGKYLYFLISCIIEIFLCILVHKLNKLHYLSLSAIVIYVIIIIFLIINSIIDPSKLKDIPLFNINDKKNVNNTSWSSFLFIMSKIIEFYYGYISHSSFPTLLSGLNNKDNYTTKKVQIIYYSILLIINFMFAIFGCSFYQENSDLLFEKEQDKDNTFSKIFIEIILSLLFIILIPIRYVVIRDNYTSLIGQEMIPLKYEILITSICLIINNIIVCFVGSSENFINKLMQYFGGVLGVFIGFVLPVISYIAINSRLKFRAICGYIITTIFIVIVFFSIFYNFQ